MKNRPLRKTQHALPLSGIIYPMCIRHVFYCKVLSWAILLSLLVTGGCSRDNPTGLPSHSPSNTETPISSPTPAEPVAPAEPTATLEPLAAIINGAPLTLAEYQAELALYQAGKGAEPDPEEKIRILQDLIAQVLLDQGAAEKGFSVDEATLQERIRLLANQLGSEQALNDWIKANGYTQAAFRKALARSIAAAWMRDQIANAVPKTAEQVHARQILLVNSEEANQALAKLQTGNDFGNLALEYDPLTGGELDWFPRGINPHPQIEQAAFELQPGQVSAVIQTVAGYHILQVIERDPQRPLAPEALLILQSRAVQDWLEQRRSQSEIQVLVS